MRGVDKKLIMIIEDSSDIQELVKMLYESEGYSVAAAPEGRKALELLRELDALPSFILLDLMMPVMDGYEFRREQLNDSDLAAIPVVVMTADANAEAKAKSLNAADFLKKPVEVAALLELAEKYCRGSTA